MVREGTTRFRGRGYPGPGVLPGLGRQPDHRRYDGRHSPAYDESQGQGEPHLGQHGDATTLVFPEPVYVRPSKIERPILYLAKSPRCSETDSDPAGTGFAEDFANFVNQVIHEPGILSRSLCRQSWPLLSPPTDSPPPRNSSFSISSENPGQPSPRSPSSSGPLAQPR